MNFQYMKDFMDFLTSWRMPGNSVVVYKDNEKVFSYNSGYSDLEKKIKMNGDELFYIYSCSKPTTVTAALQLYEKGKFLLSDPLYEYIPEFKDMTVKTADGNIEKAKSPITMRNLFTMTAGFSYDTALPYIEKARRLSEGKMDTLTVIKCLAEEPLYFNPGEHWQYSMCHDVLAAAVEVISGKKFRDYVKENIFEPLGMSDSCYHITPEIQKRMAQQYNFKPAEGETDMVKLQSEGCRAGGYIENEGKTNSLVFGEEYDSGGAGIITSVSDYAKFTAALANGGLGINGERILASGTVELLKTNQLNEDRLKEFNWPQLMGYGYGLGVRTMINRAESGSNGSIGEFGWGGAAGANVLVDTERRLSMFYTHHMLNPQEDYYQPRIRNVLYTCIDS